MAGQTVGGAQVAPGRVSEGAEGRLGAPYCYCGAAMKLRNSKYGRFWGCTRWPACDGKVGVHEGTDKPLGIPADDRTRKLRIQAHLHFDAIWEKRYMTRKRAYQWLADSLGIAAEECHIGAFDAAGCEKVIALVKELAEGTGA